MDLYRLRGNPEKGEVMAVSRKNLKGKTLHLLDMLCCDWPNPTKIATITKELDIARQNVLTKLKFLVARGDVVSVGFGLYKLKDPEQDAIAGLARDDEESMELEAG